MIINLILNRLGQSIMSSKNLDLKSEQEEIIYLKLANKEYMPYYTIANARRKYGGEE